MQKLVTLLKDSLPKETLFIWTTALPVSNEIRGGLLIKQLNFIQNLLRFEVMEANTFCRELLVSHGYDVLDIHYYLRMQILRRLRDGLHYDPEATRFITNLILTHIALSWGLPLPGNVMNAPLRRIMTGAVDQISDTSEETLDEKEIPCDFEENIHKDPSSDVQKTSILKQAIKDRVCNTFTSAFAPSKRRGKENQVLKYEKPNFKRNGGPLNRWPGENRDHYLAHIRENFWGPAVDSWRMPNNRRCGPYSRPHQELGHSNYGNFGRVNPCQRTSTFQMVNKWSQSRSCAKKLNYN